MDVRNVSLVEQIEASECGGEEDGSCKRCESKLHGFRFAEEELSLIVRDQGWKRMAGLGVQFLETCRGK